MKGTKKNLFQKQTGRWRDLEVLRNMYVHVFDLLILYHYPHRVLKYFVVWGQTLHGTFHFTVCSKNYNKNFGKSVGNIWKWWQLSKHIFFADSLNKDIYKGTLYTIISHFFTWSLLLNGAFPILITKNSFHYLTFINVKLKIFFQLTVTRKVILLIKNFFNEHLCKKYWVILEACIC